VTAVDGRSRRAVAPRVPVALGIPALVAVALLVVPLLGLLLRAPWRGLARILTTPEVADALRLSLLCATSATLLCVVVGVPLGWVLARSERRGTGLLRALVTVPLVLPPVVGGVALLLAFGRTGFVGRRLDAWFGLTLPFTTPGVVLAEAFVALPFLVLSVEGAFRSADTGLEEAAATLGASPLQTFRRVTVPLLLPAIGAGTVLAWARALGEFGATITFAGNFPGRTQTMPLAIYMGFELDFGVALALSVVLLAISFAVLAVVKRALRPDVVSA
jgi:molybdate transport system permease protein